MARRAGQAVNLEMARVSDKAAWGGDAKTIGWAIPSRQYPLRDWRADDDRQTCERWEARLVSKYLRGGGHYCER
jgi:hypothetical protein